MIIGYLDPWGKGLDNCLDYSQGFLKLKYYMQL